MKFVKKRINKESLFNLSEKFRKDEAYWVGIFRLFPFVRAIVSIPAGMVKMPHKYFIFYSLIGMFVWTSFWVLLGYLFGMSFFEYESSISLIFMIFLVLVILVFYNKMITYLKRENLLYGA